MHHVLPRPSFGFFSRRRFSVPKCLSFCFSSATPTRYLLLLPRLRRSAAAAPEEEDGVHVSLYVAVRATSRRADPDRGKLFELFIRKPTFYLRVYFLSAKEGAPIELIII
jgi:hypothetical protein